MIRKSKQEDIKEICSIWLESSIAAHDFINEKIWCSNLENMEKIYIPSSENYVYEEDNILKGFISVKENHLAAIFVLPKYQGKGVGTKLLNHIKKLRDFLSLTVYEKNTKSIEFYKNNGFESVKTQIDEHTGEKEILMKWSNNIE